MTTKPSRQDLQRIFGEFGLALRSGHYVQAAALGERLVSLVPDDADAWFNLGFSLRAIRRFESALDAYSEAIRCGVSDPWEARLNRAAIFAEHLFRPEAAELELQATLAAKPDYVPALLNLAQLKEDYGDHAEAAGLYRRIIGIAPSVGRAWARLAGLELVVGNEGEARQLLDCARQQCSGGADDAAEIAMALGQLLERSGSHRAAMAEFDRANQLIRSIRGGPARYDKAVAEDLVSKVIETFPLGNAGEVAPGGETNCFVLGLLRTGSTLVERILSQHSRVSAAGELETVPAIAGSIPGYPGECRDLDPADLTALANFYQAETASLHRPGSVLVDKRPDNFLHLGLILSIFPKARIIHTTRDDDDVALSIYANLFGPAVPYAYSLDHIRHWQEQHDRLMRHWRAVYPGVILEVPYGELVDDPSRTIDAILKHCGLDWEDACLDLPERSGSVRTLSQWQVREGINNRSRHRALPYRSWLRDYNRDAADS